MVKYVVKCVVNFFFWISTKIGVVVDMDPVIMIVVTKRQKDKKAIRQKGKKTKRQKGKKTKMQKDKITNRQKDKKKTTTKIQKKDNNKKSKINKKTKIQGHIGSPHPPQELEQGGHRPPKF